jgi:hypothetical protein
MKSTARIIPITLAIIAVAPAFADKPVVNYVGAGRYTCSGNSAQCAVIQQNNELVSAATRSRQSPPDANARRDAGGYDYRQPVGESRRVEGRYDERRPLYGR